MRATLVCTIALAAALSACAPSGDPVLAKAGDLSVPAFDATFWDHWGDGKAELSGYELTMPRYGELRTGTAVAIFVTETFSNEARVKADPGEHAKSDEFPVLKLNLVEDFATGIYDYNWMTSTFLALEPVAGRPRGFPTKVSFSGQEWCGHVYAQMLFDATNARRMSHSYFDGEADQQGQLDTPADGITEDALWHWARGWAAPQLRRGDSIEVPLLMALKRSRAKHQSLNWEKGTLARAAEPETIEVPAGAFEVERYTATWSSGYIRTFYVETAMPHRIIRWETTEGERAEILATERLPYWALHDNEHLGELTKLGLTPRSEHMP